MKAILAGLALMTALTAPAAAATKHVLAVAIDANGIRSERQAHYPASKPIHVTVHASPDTALDDFTMRIQGPNGAAVPVALTRIDKSDFEGDVKVPAAGHYTVAMTAQVGGIKYPAPAVTIDATGALLANLPLATTVALASVPFVGALAGVFFFRKRRFPQLPA